MRIGQTSFVVFASHLVGSALGFLATLYFARNLGPEIIGYYAIALVVVKWFQILGDVGIGSAVVKRISEGEEISAYFTAGLTSIGILGVVSSLIIFLFRDSVNVYVGVDVAPYVVLMLLTNFLVSILGAALSGERLVHLAGLLNPVRIGSQSLIQITLVSAGLGLTGMFLGYAAGGLVFASIGVLVISVGLERPRFEHFRSLFNYSKFSWLGSLSGRSFNDVDIIVLGALVSPALVGVYSVAWSLTSFIGAFGSSILQTTFPELSRADAEERERLLAKVVTDSLAFNGLLAIPGVLGGLLLGDRVLRVYGDEFVRGAYVLGILILAMLIFDYQNQLLNALNAIDRPDLSFQVNAVFIVANITLNVVLVVLFGWEGAAVATVLSASVGLTLAFVYLYRLVDFDVPLGELARQTAAALVMALVVGITRLGFESADLINHNFAVVSILVVLGILTYFLGLTILSERFRSTVVQNSPIPIQFMD